MAIRPITPTAARALLDNHEALLIDVREPSEHAVEHIAGARLAPLDRVSPADLGDAGDRMIIVHCQKGGRSRAACERLQSALPGMDLYNLEGGLAAWRAAGLPVVAALPDRTILPLDRQVQLTVGLGLLIGSALGALVHPAFFALAAVFGLGLTVAGTTGFCGLARILGAMPWNASRPA